MERAKTKYPVIFKFMTSFPKCSGLDSLPLSYGSNDIIIVQITSMRLPVTLNFDFSAPCWLLFNIFTRNSCL